MTAPADDDESEVRRAVRFARNVLLFVVAVAVLGGLAVSAVFDRLGHVESVARTQTRNQEEIQQTQADGIIRGYKNRTPDCVALLLSSSTRLPNVCTEKPVLPYVCEAAAQSNPAWVQRIETQVGHPCPFPAS